MGRIEADMALESCCSYFGSVRDRGSLPVYQIVCQNVGVFT